MPLRPAPAPAKPRASAATLGLPNQAHAHACMYPCVAMERKQARCVQGPLPPAPPPGRLPPPAAQYSAVGRASMDLPGTESPPSPFGAVWCAAGEPRPRCTAAGDSGKSGQRRPLLLQPCRRCLLLFVSSHLANLLCPWSTVSWTSGAPVPDRGRQCSLAAACSMQPVVHELLQSSAVMSCPRAAHAGRQAMHRG